MTFKSDQDTDPDGPYPTCLQCCGSGMFIPDPGSRILIFTHPGSRIPDSGSRIPDPGSKNSNKRVR
jgi:hypothetical protein